MSVLGIGNALVDIVTELKDDSLLKRFGLPKGSMTLVDSELSNQINFDTVSLKKTKASGGSAANTIHGLAKLGVEAAFIGKTGKDDLGTFYQKDLDDAGVCTIMYHSLADTGKAMALISPDAERTFATYLGAAVELSEEDISSKIVSGYDFFYIEGYLINNLPLFEKSLRLAKKAGMRTCLDLASYNIVEQYKDKLLPEIKSYVDILFANEEEANALTGKSPEDALNEISSYCDITIIKTGPKGSMIRSENNIHEIHANQVNVVDTTGAGDLYASGFLYGLSKNMPLTICGRIGTLLAGKVIENYGARIQDDVWPDILSSIESLK